MKNIMKFLVSLIIIVIFCSKTLLAQQDQIAKIEKQVFAMADTFKTKFSDYTISLAYGELTSFTIRRDIKYFKIVICYLVDLKATADLIQAAKKLSDTKNYYNKILGHQINLFLISGLILKEDTLINQRKDYSIIEKLIQQIIISDFKYCARYTDLSLFEKLKKRHYTTDVILDLKTLLANPNKTSEEAKIIASSMRPEYSIIDTIGYRYRVKQYQDELQKYKEYGTKLKEFNNKAKEANESIEEWLNLHDTSAFKEKLKDCVKHLSELEIYTRKINNWLVNAEKSKMTVKHWLDSMQITHDTTFVKKYVKESLILLPVLNSIGQNYLSELAPDIEQLLSKGKLVEYEKSNAELQLSRLQYKEYEKEVIQRINNEIKLIDGSNYIAYRKLFEKLIYINTQESFYAIAPLLLNKNIWGDNLNRATIGARIFIQLDNHIKNFPFNKKQLIDKVSEGGKYDVFINEMIIDYELGELFLEKIYQWMIENKGNYDIIKLGSEDIHIHAI
jgi:hypothetical protein